MTAPYYQEAGVTIYCGDAREVLPTIVQPPAWITDPVWPNSVFPEVPDPAGLFAETLTLFQSERLVVHLGCTSDPRFLQGVPAHLPFIRACWLRYARPSYRGRILVGSDVAYVYGSIPASRPGRRVLSGECVARNNASKPHHTGRGKGSSEGIDYAAMPHRSPRRYEHLSWLVGIYGDGGVLDPFAGQGTTLLAAKNAGIPAIGIEIEERHCEQAAERLVQGVLDLQEAEA